jgi:hypothetical protein
MARRLDPLQERFRAAIEETWRIAPLGVWTSEHHAEMTRLLRGHRSPPWDRIAENFAAAGLTDGQGRKPTAETARLTWEVVCAARKARRRR